MINDDLYILHLSDLHIKNEGKARGSCFYSNALKRLIEDIALQSKNQNGIILVVSGDIVDQGKYDMHIGAVKKFFFDLHRKIGDKVSDVVIVPGNHDKHRSRINTLISMAHITTGLNHGQEDSDCEWNAQLDAYEHFLGLTKYIYELFGKDTTNLAVNTYGVDVVCINGFNVCFLRLDTAWCSHSANDYRQLRLGDYQLKALYSEYKEARNKCEASGLPISLTVAISHYPLNWLTVEDEEVCNSYFLSKDFLDVDILLCGHVHDFSVINYFNHEHSLLTLVTGIGWGNTKPSMEAETHRYSLYVLNLFHNSCDIIMRKTKSNNAFDYDYSVYAGEYEISDNKLRYPLKVKESNPFIRINSPLPIEAKSLFVDNNILNKIPEVSKSISSFSDSIAKLYSRYSDDFVDGLIEDMMPDYYSDSLPLERREECNSILSQINDYFAGDHSLTDDFVSRWFNSKISFNGFLAFLSEICVNAVEELKDCFSNESKLRAHFRWHDIDSNDSYSMLCQFSNLPDDQKVDTMQGVSWDGFIRRAFETGEPLIYSANKKYNPISTSWDDFITIVPQFNNFTHDIRIGKKAGANERRPILSFGLSIKETEYERDILSLYLLGYLRLDHVLTQAIDEYIRLFNIDAKSFLSQIQEIRNKL